MFSVPFYLLDLSNLFYHTCYVETEKGIFDAILEGHIDFESQPWPNISNSAKDLVRKMLIQDPKKRITSAQVLGIVLFVLFLLNVVKCFEFIKLRPELLIVSS